MKKTSSMAHIKKSLFRQKLWGALALCAVLGLVFWLYTQPHLVIMLSDQLWACF
jgi:hypothetical protein